MNCRPRCGACCIALSISSPIPGMPNGKAAGIRCIHLNAKLKCNLFGSAHRPPVCSAIDPQEDLCGVDRIDALNKIAWLEQKTKP
ncbi:MAG: YkgJ family cysteine cluster protein [Methylococcales bacterium]